MIKSDKQFIGKTMAVGFLMALAVGQAAQAGDLRVMFMGRGNDPMVKNLISSYRKNHPQTRITPIMMDWEDQAAAIAKKPDVYIGPNWFLSENVDIGIFEDLGKLLPKQVLSDIIPELLASKSIGRKIFGVPVFGYASHLVSNKGLFDQAGLAVPDSTWSWKGKFYEACRKLSRDGNGDGKMEHYGMVGLPGRDLLPLFYSFGGTITDKAMKKVTYTEKPGMEAIEYILRLHKEKVLEHVDWSEFSNDTPQKDYPWNNGKSAMTLSWSDRLDMKGWDSWLKREKIPITPVASPIPAGPKGNIATLDSDVATLMCTCKNKKEAAEFLRFIADLKGQSMLCSVWGLPTTKSGISTAKLVKKAPAPFLKSYRLGKARPLDKRFGAVEGLLFRDMNNILNNEGTMKDLTDNAKGEATEALANTL